MWFNFLIHGILTKNKNMLNNFLFSLRSYSNLRILFKKSHHHHHNKIIGGTDA